MVSAGSDDEIAWVMAQEAAHMMFAYTRKKMANATSAQMATGALAIALDVAVGSPAILDSAGDISMAGYEAGYVAYSPEMEIEADQFAAYVLEEAGLRPEATLDMIVRLHRGAVPAPVCQGDGWAGYLGRKGKTTGRSALMGK